MAAWSITLRLEDDPTSGAKRPSDKLAESALSAEIMGDTPTLRQLINVSMTRCFSNVSKNDESTERQWEIVLAEALCSSPSSGSRSTRPDLPSVPHSGHSTITQSYDHIFRIFCPRFGFQVPIFTRRESWPSYRSCPITTPQEATQSRALPMHTAYTQPFSSEHGCNECNNEYIVGSSLHFPKVPSFLERNTFRSQIKG